MRWLALSLSAVFLACAAPAAAQQIPTVEIVSIKTAPPTPTGGRPSCAESDKPVGLPTTCPILKYHGYTYWPFGLIHGGMQVVGFDAKGNIVGRWDAPAVSDVWKIVAAPQSRLIVFIGKGKSKFVILRDRLLAFGPPGGLTITQMDFKKLLCDFDKLCQPTLSESAGVIDLPGGVMGSVHLFGLQFAGAYGTLGGGKTEYLFRIDMSKALSAEETPNCITELKLDVGPINKLAYAASGVPSEIIVGEPPADMGAGLYSATVTGNTVNFVFDEPVCPGPTVGSGLSSRYFGFASIYPPKPSTATVVWSGTPDGTTTATTPAHP